MQQNTLLQNMFKTMPDIDLEIINVLRNQNHEEVEQAFIYLDNAYAALDNLTLVEVAVTSGVKPDSTLVSNILNNVNNCFGNTLDLESIDCDDIDLEAISDKIKYAVDAIQKAIDVVIGIVQKAITKYVSDFGKAKRALETLDKVIPNMRGVAKEDTVKFIGMDKFNTGEPTDFGTFITLAKTISSILSKSSVTIESSTSELSILLRAAEGVDDPEVYRKSVETIAGEIKNVLVDTYLLKDNDAKLAKSMGVSRKAFFSGLLLGNLRFVFIPPETGITGKVKLLLDKDAAAKEETKSMPTLAKSEAILMLNALKDVLRDTEALIEGEGASTKAIRTIKSDLSKFTSSSTKAKNDGDASVRDLLDLYRTFYVNSPRWLGSVILAGVNYIKVSSEQYK